MPSRAERQAKGLRCKWEAKDMKTAMEFVKKQKMGVNEAARVFNLPKTTLKRKLKLYQEVPSVEKLKVQLGRHADLPKELENDLVQHCLHLERMFYGLTRDGLQKLAYEIAEKNKVSTRFNSEKQFAGPEWYRGFMSRHPQLSLRLPEATSLARAAGFNRVVVDAFYDVYEKIVADNQLTAATIFNIDETSHTVVQKPRRVIAQKGKHQVGAVTSCERGQNVTGTYCMSASGFYLPPFFIYPRKRMKESLTYGAPPGTTFHCQEKGWMDSNGFYEFLQHFIRHVRPSKDHKVLIVLDGHSSHTQTMKAIELARENGIIMLSLPSHCTHRMQPLDVSFFKPLNMYFSAAITSKLHECPGKSLKVDQISSLLGKAFPRAATMEVAINGFRKTGLWPPDRHVFTDADFAAAEVTNRPFSEDLLSGIPCQEAKEIVTVQSAMPSTSATSSDRVTPCPSTSKVPSISSILQTNTYIPVQDISPLPTCVSISGASRKKKRFNASGVELTASPYKAQLEVQQSTRNNKKERASSNLFDNKKGNTLKKTKKREKNG